jgi:hypothetical protein
MKKCYSCGATLEDDEVSIQEFGEVYYCIFCLDKDGKPPKLNPIRKSMIDFWHDRDSKNKESS